MALPYWLIVISHNFTVNVWQIYQNKNIVRTVFSPGDNDGDVEAQYEGDRYELRKGFAVKADLLEQLL